MGTTARTTTVAYFSMEIGLDLEIPTYSGRGRGAGGLAASGRRGSGPNHQRVPIGGREDPRCWACIRRPSSPPGLAGILGLYSVSVRCRL